MKGACLRNFRCFGYTLFLVVFAVVSACGQTGYWKISQLSITNVEGPVINNSGEIVWFLNLDGGVFSSVRGKLADSGLFPHLANSGEVVYADWFGGQAWDLVSTTKGRLTYGSLIDLNRSSFDVNAKGEVVYSTLDTNLFYQIYSTVRGQVTFDAANHVNPSINDLGEILWNQYDTYGSKLVSSTRGVIPGLFPALLDLNNKGEFCFMGNLEGPPGNYSSPHIFSSVHGVIITNSVEFQWGGSINDAGTIVWNAPVEPGSSTWYVYQADWVVVDATPPKMKRLTVSRAVLWPPNGEMVPVTLRVRASDNMDPAPVCRIAQVLCNVPQNSANPDWVITGPLSLNLRSAVTGSRQGRIYTIIVQCTDKSGNSSNASVQVLAPFRFGQGGFH